MRMNGEYGSRYGVDMEVELDMEVEVDMEVVVEVE